MSERLVSIHRLKKPSLLAAQPRRKAERPTPERPLIISASELGSFLRCRVKHHWEYQCQLEPKTTRVPLVMGRIGHKIIQDFYAQPFKERTPKRMAKIADAEIKLASVKELPLEDKQLLRAMVIGYVEWAQNPDTEYNDMEIGVKECYPEEKFELPLTKDGSIRVHGRLDLRFPSATQKKTLGFLESKFLAQIRVDAVEHKIQNTIYLWAMRTKFPTFKRYKCYYQVLRKQMPGPRVKADLFHREPLERDISEIDQWAEDAQAQAMDMLDGAVYPSPMDSCSWGCDFKIPCLQRGNDGDVKYILKTEFQRRKYNG